VSSVILTDGCADLYNPKTIRASMGAVCRQRVCHESIPELAELVAGGLKLIGAALGGQDISNVSLKDAVVAIGSEGRGLSDEVLELCGVRAAIPIAPECESLNAAIAASIIMWEAAK